MSINVNDIFWTIQGEGKNAGRRALFVRMPFCNLACSWCDTSFETFHELTENDFTKYATEEDSRFAVITGGEPSMNKHVPKLITWLKDLDFEIAMESNGTFAPPEGVDHLTVSPKKEQRIHPPYYIHPVAYSEASEFKFIVDAGFDFSILNSVRTHNAAEKYLSPEFNTFDESVDDIIKFISLNPEWKISLQTHKWMKIK
jgi:organic radical activating enzyme